MEVRFWKTLIGSNLEILAECVYASPAKHSKSFSLIDCVGAMPMAPALARRTQPSTFHEVFFKQPLRLLRAFVR